MESFRGRLIRVVRRAPRKHQQKRLPAGRVSPQVLDRVRRLRLCVVAVPLSLRRIVVLVIERPVIVVRTFQGLEVLEPLTPLGRDVRRAAVAVEVPLADVAGDVAGRLEGFGDGDLTVGKPPGGVGKEDAPGTGQPGVNTVTCGKCNSQVAPGKFYASCGSELAAAAASKFCSNCGSPISAGPANCTKCGQPLDPGAKFCANCGNKIG